MFKKVILFLLTILTMFMFCGCWNYTEMDSQTIVAGIAIDKGENGKKVHVSMEMISMQASKTEAPVSSIVVEDDGDTVLEAIRKTIAITSKKLYFGHCKVLIISKDIAKDGIIQIIDLIIRDSELRANMDIVVSKANTAKEILMLKPVSSPIVSYEIDDMLVATMKSLGESYKTEVFEFYNMLGTPGRCPVAPAIEPVNQSNSEKTFKLSGVAFFKKDKLAGFLNEEDTKTSLFIVNRIKGGALSIKVNDNQNTYLSAEILENKTKIKPEKKGNELIININTQTVLNVEEFKDDALSQQEFEKIFNIQLEEKIYSVIQKVQNEYGLDIYGFGNKIRQTNPKLWEEYRDNWNETFKTLKVNVKSNAAFKSSGIININMEVGK